MKVVVDATSIATRQTRMLAAARAFHHSVSAMAYGSGKPRNQRPTDTAGSSLPLAFIIIRKLQVSRIQTLTFVVMIDVGTSLDVPVGHQCFDMLLDLCTTSESSESYYAFILLGPKFIKPQATKEDLAKGQRPTQGKPCSGWALE